MNQQAAADPQKDPAQDPSKNTSDFIPKKDYDSLVSERDRLTQHGQGLADQLKTASDERAALEAKLADLTKAAKSTPGNKSKANPDDLEEFENKIRSEFAPIVESKDAEIKSLKEQIKEFTIVNKTMEIGIKYLNDDAVPIYKELVKKYFDQDKGNPKAVIVKDDYGKVRHSPKNPALPMSEEEWWEERRTINPSSFKATAVTSGSMPSGQMSSGVKGTGHDPYASMSKEQYITTRPNLDRATRVQLDKRFGL